VTTRRPLAVLTAAEAAGQAGAWAALIAALPAALAHPRAPVWVAVVTAAWAGPAAIGGRLAGRPADRWGPRSTSVVSWALAAGGAAGCVTAWANLPAVITLLALQGLARGAGVTAGDAAPTWMPQPPDQAHAGAMLSRAAYLPLMAGPLGAAALLAAAGPRDAWAAVATAYAAGAALSALVPARRPAAETSAEARPGTAAARILAVTGLVWLTYGILTIAEPLYVREQLHRGLEAYGWMLSSYAAGALAASELISRWRPAAPGRAVAWSALAVGASEWAYLSTGRYGLTLAGAALWGASCCVFGVGCRVAILAQAPPQAHGRALGRWRAIQSAAELVPAAFTGQAVLALGLPAVIAATCVLAAVSGAVCLRPATLRAAAACAAAAAATTAASWQIVVILSARR
jgi:MFS family permease